MRTRNLIVGILALAAFAPFAGAASSFTYSTFVTIVGTFVQPLVPQWSYGTQLQPATIAVASTTQSGASLSGGKLVIKVLALSATGTSTPSNEYATTTTAANALIISWATVPGATGYAVAFGTSTPGSEHAYFMATSTAGAANTTYTLTSTSSPTYYAIPSSGSGFYASLGSGTSTMSTSGAVRLFSAATTTACSEALDGTIFYNEANEHLWLCQSGAWAAIK